MKSISACGREALLLTYRALVGGATYQAAPIPWPCVFYANHGSHLDVLGILQAVPAASRAQLRPVAGADYWGQGRVRRWIGEGLLNVVLIDRCKGGPEAIAPLLAALDAGQSLILFPEGTRGASARPGEFKSGLFHLSKQRPSVPMIPVYQSNLYRALPKGRFVPLPLLSSTHIGAPLYNDRHEDKEAFLARAHAALCALNLSLESLPC